MGLGQLLADPEQGWLDDVVDRGRYPIGTADEPSLVDQVRAELDRDGAANLAGFLQPHALRTVREELRAAAAHVSMGPHRGTVYARKDLEQQLDPSDPRRSESEWYGGHVTRDMIPAYSPAHRLYVSPVFKRFIAQCVGQERVFEYADPLAGLVATVLPPGGRYPWHYDTNEFVATIVIRRPESGGLFEYSKDLRRPGLENLGGLTNVLDGSDRASIHVSDNHPGDLQLFRGRYSLHRVTTVGGRHARHVLVLSYADRPGVIGPLDRTRSLYGRVTEAHLIAAESSRIGADGLIL